MDIVGNHIEEVVSVGRQFWDADTKYGAKFGVSDTLEESRLVVGGWYGNLIH